MWEGRYPFLSRYVVLILSKPDMWKPDFKDVCISFRWIKVVQNQKETHKKTSTIKFTFLDFIRNNAKRQLIKRLPKLGCEWILSGYMPCIMYMWYPSTFHSMRSLKCFPVTDNYWVSLAYVLKSGYVGSLNKCSWLPKCVMTKKKASVSSKAGYCFVKKAKLFNCMTWQSFRI